jgi:hypothetical protein
MPTRGRGSDKPTILDLVFTNYPDLVDNIHTNAQGWLDLNQLIYIMI